MPHIHWWNDIGPFFGALWNRWVGFITGGTVAAGFVIYAAIGNTISRGWVLLLVSFALASSAFVVWHEERNKARALERILQPKRILDGMAQLVKRGRELRYEAIPGPGVVPADIPGLMQRAKEWANDAEKYIAKELGEFALVDFEYQHYGSLGLSPAYTELLMFIGPRGAGIEKIVDDLKAGRIGRMQG